jgi:hypothetical protein
VLGLLLHCSIYKKVKTVWMILQNEEEVYVEGKHGEAFCFH